MKAKLLVCAACLLSAFSSRAQEWYEIPSGTNKKLNTISFPSSTVGYIGGNDSLLLKTTDGGRHWSEVNYSGVTFYPEGDRILKLQFISETTGFMTVGPYSGNYKTTDGGLTWNFLSPQTIILCYNQGLYFFDENNGFVGGSGCFTGETIGKLSNGDWTESELDATTMAENYITDIDFLNTSFGLATSRSGYIYRTTDGGVNWDSIPSSNLQVMDPLTSVQIINDTLAYATYTAFDIGFGVLISTDGGLSWEVDMNSATFYYPKMYSSHQSGNGNLYAGGISFGADEGLIYEWTDNLENWNYFSLDQRINGISSYNDSIVFAVGDSGYVVVNHDFGNLGIKESDFSSPESFSLYPNPSKGLLKLELNLVQENGAFLRLYDVNGKLLRVTAYESAVDVSDLRSGLYILELQSAAGVRRARFMKE